MYMRRIWLNVNKTEQDRELEIIQVIITNNQHTV